MQFTPIYTSCHYDPYVFVLDLPAGLATEEQNRRVMSMLYLKFLSLQPGMSTLEIVTVEVFKKSVGMPL